MKPTAAHGDATKSFRRDSSLVIELPMNAVVVQISVAAAWRIRKGQLIT